MRWALLVFLVGCEIPCEWEGLGEPGWALTELDNGCELPTTNAIDLGCRRYFGTNGWSMDKEECTRSVVYTCGTQHGEHLFLYLTYARYPDRGYYLFKGKLRGDSCVTTYTLVPADER